MTLRDLKPGDTAKVVKINGEGAIKRRIMDMGLTKGTGFSVRKVHGTYQRNRLLSAEGCSSWRSC